MTYDDNDFERRLRAALTRPQRADRVDSDALLDRVHRGARARRTRRRVAVATVGAVVLVGGGAVVNAGGFLDPPTRPIADPPQSHTASPPSRSFERPTPPPTQHSSGPGESTPPSTSPTGDGSVTISPGGPLGPGEVHPLSLTATGTAHQWVLASTPGRDCSTERCASVLSTSDHGDSWTDLGVLPAPPASAADESTPESVGSLRFAARSDGSGTYDGWAFGAALWSTHDSGASWSAARSPAGSVTALEAWGGYAYAAVSSPVVGDDTATLYRTPTTSDDWQPVDVGVPLGSVSALAAANGLVGLIDIGSGLTARLYISADGDTWSLADACPSDGGMSPEALSTASDDDSGASALWVTCSSGSRTVLRYTDTTALGTWHDAQTSTMTTGSVVAARDARTALVAGGDVEGAELVSGSTTPQSVPTGPVSDPVLFAFTNPRYGYLLGRDGSILSTTDGGGSWSSYDVVP